MTAEFEIFLLKQCAFHIGTVAWVPLLGGQIFNAGIQVINSFQSPFRGDHEVDFLYVSRENKKLFLDILRSS